VKKLRIGIDVGSTTLKIVVLDENMSILYKRYERHFSDIKATLINMIEDVKTILNRKEIAILITGSAGMGISKKLNIPFVQEVIASTRAIERFIPHTDVAIELGGEDAKITYLGHSLEQRMNGTCAGGTGAFIDQMASLLQTDASGLNEYAKNYKTIYPVASRCGVFAKTDIQPLLNEGASKEDISASVFQAVVNQTISGLAQGKPIRGRVAFLGGPLYFLSELRKRFVETLKLKNEEIIFPEDSQFFVALGAAILAEESPYEEFECLYERIPDIHNSSLDATNISEPLFKNNEEYEEFKLRHEKSKVKRFDLNKYEGNAFLGIDAGSTTTKVALINTEGELLYSYYGSNKGSPLKSTIDALNDLSKNLNANTKIVNSVVTGYGENLLKEALKIDIGEIETVAHYKAANFFLPGVEFILDIGGQDMKSLKIHEGVIDSIMLNEACSSGCGSFIETFGKSLNIDIKDFAKKGLFSKKPVDLGTRCTVFMNSKVKQAQKDGAEVADISAGISLSVIKNALYKVIRLRNVEDLGEKIVVQGGTFYNESVLRSIEKILNKEVIRPDISGIMGAFGAALIAKERYKENYESTLLFGKSLENFEYKTNMARCKLCGNNCLLTINLFPGGRKFVSGNRCERGAGIESKTQDIPNIYDYKYKRVFDYTPLENPIRGTIGIPRALNIFEDYPFWFTFFNELKYKVILSTRSNKKLFEKGMETIPSESVCYPAKLVHGHIMDLIEKNVDKIFYPSIPWNIKEDKNSTNTYNCPIVISYPETILANINKLKDEEVKFYNPFLPINNPKRMYERLLEVFEDEKIDKKEIKSAVKKAYEELENYKEDVRKKGEEILKYLEDNNNKGIVLAGRPYHIDPEINNGIPEVIKGFGYAILCEDSISHLSEVERPLRVVDQWVYHNRMYRAASYVAKKENLELIQLNSFGCGLDAVTTDQVKEILEQYGKIYTVLKIDEITNLGAARIRIRSLIAAIKEREKKNFKPEKLFEIPERVKFEVGMKEKHTLLIPQMSPIHFQFLEAGLNRGGYNAIILPAVDKSAIDEGLRYVNNDACYPSIIVVGQIMEALKSGKYDINNTSVMISQTGGGCRATNYIAFIRKALKDAGMEHVPVISASLQGLEKNPGFKVSLDMAQHMVMGVLLGDLLMRVIYKVRPYEKVKGSTNELAEKWFKKCREDLENGGFKEYKENIKQIVKDFDNLEIDETITKPKVGIVGEILVKFHPTANNDIVDLLESEGAEAVMPDLFDFFLYGMYSQKFNREQLAGKFSSFYISKLSIKVLEFYRGFVKRALKQSKRFTAPMEIEELAKGAEEHLSIGNQTGEGWFLTAEMIELIHSGVENIVCLQPFACLPNHITGKGMIKELRRAYPNSNIAAIDYDPGASEVNQINRIKLMLSIAFNNLKKEKNKNESKEENKKDNQTKNVRAL